MFGFTPFGESAFGQVPEETTPPPPPPPPSNTFVPWIYGIIIALRDKKHRDELEKNARDLKTVLELERKLEEEIANEKEPVFSRCESFSEEQSCDIVIGQASFSEAECRSTIGRTEFDVNVIRPVRSRSFSRSPVQSTEAFVHQDFADSELVTRELDEIALICSQSKEDFDSLELLDDL